MAETESLGFGEPRHVAYAMVGTGLTFSLAANVTHGLITNGGIGAVISGLVWPLSLVLTIEGASRLPWPKGRWWMAFRIVTAAPVAATAAIVSYLHMSGLLDHWHEHWLTCLLGPIAVDGLTTLGAAGLLILDRSTDLAEPAHEPVQGAVTRPSGPAQAAELSQPTGPAQFVDTQVTASTPEPAPAKTAVSQRAIDAVLAAVRSGQPMTKGEIVSATPLSRSTVTRAVDHLLAVGQLRTLGDAAQPSYVLAQSTTKEKIN